MSSLHHDLNDIIVGLGLEPQDAFIEILCALQQLAAEKFPKKVNFVRAESIARLRYLDEVGE